MTKNLHYQITLLLKLTSSNCDVRSALYIWRMMLEFQVINPSEGCVYFDQFIAIRLSPRCFYHITAIGLDLSDVLILRVSSHWSTCAPVTSWHSMTLLEYLWLGNYHLIRLFCWCDKIRARWTVERGKNWGAVNTNGINYLWVG